MVANRSYVPAHGDIVWVDLNPTKGHEQKGKRPALVVSPKAYNAKACLVLLCPITSRAKGYTFEIPILVGSTESVVLSDQVRSVDWKERKIEKFQRAPGDVVTAVQANIRKLLGD
jgi:mRNA interferase MazF